MVLAVSLNVGTRAAWVQRCNFWSTYRSIISKTHQGFFDGASVEPLWVSHTVMWCHSSIWILLVPTKSLLFAHSLTIYIFHGIDIPIIIVRMWPDSQYVDKVCFLICKYVHSVNVKWHVVDKETNAHSAHLNTAITAVSIYFQCTLPLILTKKYKMHALSNTHTANRITHSNIWTEKNKCQTWMLTFIIFSAFLILLRDNSKCPSDLPPPVISTSIWLFSVIP